jgi:hypothetical protein
MTMKKRYNVAIEYIADNDEPTVTDPAEMTGYASVQVVAITFGKTVEEVAVAVVRSRRKRDEDSRHKRRIQ